MGKQVIYGIAMVMALVAGSRTASADRTIPFVRALDNAAVSVERLDNILEYALIIGNGDINALIYTDSGNIALVLTKNDVWDARLDTKLDPPLPTLKRIKELAHSNWPNRGMILPKGMNWKGPDSYHAHPYPCPRACARLILGTHAKRPGWQRIRAQGRHNGWEFRDGVGIMSIAGDSGVSNGWQCEPLEFSTDDPSTIESGPMQA